MTKLKVRVVAGSLAVLAAILYVVCRLFYLVWPKQTLDFFNTWFHGVDFSVIAKNNLTVSSFILGLVGIVIVSWLVGALFAIIYNWKLKLYGEK